MMYFFGRQQIINFRYIFVLSLLLTTVSSVNLQAQDSDQEKFKIARALLPDSALKAEPLATELYRKALATGNDSLLARSQYLLGTINYLLSRFYISVDFFEKALATDFAKTNLQLAEACWNNQGNNYDRLNLFPEALEAYQQSLLLAEKRNDSTGIAQTWINIGLLASRVKHYEEAEMRTRQALQFFIRQKDTLNIALSYQNLGSIYDLQNLPATSDSFVRASLDLYKAADNKYGIVELSQSLALSYSKKNEYARSDSLLYQSLNLARKMEMNWWAATAMMNLGENAANTGRFAAAESWYQQALSTMKVSGSTEKNEEILQLMADLYARLGKYAEYQQARTQIIELADSSAKETSLARYDELKNLYDHEQNTREILEQKQRLDRRQQQLYWIAGGGILLLLALIIISVLYVRTRNLMQSLYRNNLAFARQQGDQHLQIKEENQPLRNRQLYEKLVRLIEQKKLYSRSNLEVLDLATAMGTNESTIQFVIREYSSHDFTGFLNELRVNEARRMMVEKANSISLQEIEQHCGFGNASTFYRYFREQTGLTPSAFLAMCKQEMPGRSDGADIPKFSGPA